MPWIAALRIPRPAPVQLLALAGGLAGLYLAVFALAFPGFDAEKSARPAAQAPAHLTPDGRPMPVFDHKGMRGALAYYGRRRVTNLRSPESVADFLAGGGRAIVVKARKLEWLESIAPGPLVVHDRSRSGRRELLVVGPSKTP